MVPCLSAASARVRVLRRFELNDELSLRFDPDGDRGLENECFGGESAHILQSSLDGSEFQLIDER